jgi:hypothetical protein
MEQKIFHGDFSLNDLAECLVVNFNRGNLMVNQFAADDTTIVQIKTRDDRASGGDTALTLLSRKSRMALQYKPVSKPGWVWLPAWGSPLWQLCTIR